MRIIDIFNRLTTQGGVTLALDSTEYTGTEGFVVGVHSAYVEAEEVLALLARFIQHATTVGLTEHAGFEYVVGAWRLPEGTRYSVDINVVIHDEVFARKLAVRTQQKAIYDLEAQEVIDIPDVATPGKGVPIPQIIDTVDAAYDELIIDRLDCDDLCERYSS